MTINSNEIAEALNPHLVDIAASVQNVFNQTPPELVRRRNGKRDHPSRVERLGCAISMAFFERIHNVPTYIR